jgi:hypothetical protein
MLNELRRPKGFRFWQPKDYISAFKRTNINKISHKNQEISISQLRKIKAKVNTSYK